MTVAALPGDAALARVLSLPRRAPASPELIAALSRAMRSDPNAVEHVLRPAQVEALRELWEYRGLFAPMRVGSGKSLVTLLAATLLCAMRPVLVIPAALREKTKREFALYARHWRVRLPTLVSYQELGRPDRERMLLDLDPDLLLADEAQWLFNADSAVARRWVRAAAQVRERGGVVAVLSGTLFGANLMRYHHLAVGALGERAPMPVQHSEAERWAAALDRDLGILHRIGAGELDTIPGGYHDWFRGSRGVVPTPGSDCDASIQFSIWRPDVPPALQNVIGDVAVSSLRPDDELLDEFELPECLLALALGFYYRWDPMPPDWWLRPRRAWRRYVRDVLDEHIEGFDSESQIVSALDFTTEPAPPGVAEGKRKLAEWRAIRDEFKPNPVPVWIDASIMAQAADHARRQKGSLVWTRFRAAGEMLAHLGVPYYGGGTQPDSHAKPGQPIALSIAAHATGRNMQAWHRSIVLTPPANADAWEQLIGRTHRAGQKADPVLVECIGTIDHHGAVLGRVLAEARANTKASGFTHKLCLADWT